MRHKLTAILIFALAAAHPTLGQNVATTALAWQADQATDLQTGKATPYAAVFKTFASDRVEWVQKNGQMVSSYLVESVTGVWDNLSVDGSIVYTLIKNDKRIVMLIEKKNATTTVTLNFKVGAQDNKHQFRIYATQQIQ